MYNRQKVEGARGKHAQTEKIAMDFKESLYAAYREHIDAIDKIMPDEAEEQKLSEATDEELVDSALELAERKYEQEQDLELPPMRHEKSQDAE